MKRRQTIELVRIAAAGGGFRLDAKIRTIDELVQIAAAASNSGARLEFQGMQTRTTDELVRIAAAGRGAVVFMTE
jgi:hypothetical protein